MFDFYLNCGLALLINVVDTVYDVLLHCIQLQYNTNSVMLSIELKFDLISMYDQVTVSPKTFCICLHCYSL